MSVKKTTQYGEDVVMFLLNKIIKNKKIELSAKKMLAFHMVLKPCAQSTFFFADISIFNFLLFC